MGRALWFANVEDGFAAKAVYRKMRVLPPNAHYLIDRDGGVFCAVRRFTDREGEVERRRKAIRRALDQIIRGTAPANTRLPASKRIEMQRRRKVDEPALLGEKSVELTVELADVIEVDFAFANLRWWRAQSAVRGRVVDDDRLVAPTLDALIGAALVKLWSDRQRLRKCVVASCAKYFVRVGDKRESCCSFECKETHRRESGRDRANRKRHKDRSMRAESSRKAVW